MAKGRVITKIARKKGCLYYVTAAGHVMEKKLKRRARKAKRK